jgi:SAM-dependent methyltransferase
MADLVADRTRRDASPEAPASLLAAWHPGAPRADTWRPDPGTDLRDGRALHELLYEGGDLRHPRPWCAPATRLLVARAMGELEEQIARVRPGETIRVLDYGTGTGLAAIELLKLCRRRDVERRVREAGARIELHLVDVPTSWFAQGYELLRGCSWTRFHALVDAGGRFRALPEVLGERPVDLVMASMVFHLIPARALARVASGLAEVMTPDGRLLWNAPDVGPPQPRTILFHDPNRTLRARWKELVRGRRPPANEPQRDAVAVARSGDGATIDDERANRRILPRANTADEVAAAFGACFGGTIVGRGHEMLRSESVDLMLVPSNQEEYLPEIDDEPTRSRLIEELLRDEVLPAVQAGPAGTGDGHNVHWTFGDHRVRAR